MDGDAGETVVAQASAETRDRGVNSCRLLEVILKSSDL